MNAQRRSLLASIPAMFVGGALKSLAAENEHAYLSQASSRLTTNFVSNPHLPTILKNWEGTPQESSGRFVNYEYPLDSDIFRFIDWQLKGKSPRLDKKNDPFHLRVIRDDSFLKSDEDCVVWFGHATFFFRLAGVTFITDPVFGNLFMRDRLCSLPVSPEYLSNLDIILQSHVHADHADEPSMKYLSKRNQKSMYLCGLEAGEVITEFTGSTNIQQAGWYQQYDTSFLTGGRKVEVFYMPARHWSRRGLFDQNKQLWGGFVLRGNGKTIYWGGDSGYGSHFARAKELFGKIDLCIAGVGAYKPEWFMSQNHTSPTDAVRAADDMGASVFIPMHYGTYDLGDDTRGEPVRALEHIREQGKVTTTIRIPHVGEIVKI